MDSCEDLNIQTIQEKLRAYTEKFTPGDDGRNPDFKKAAVLLLLVCIEGEWNLLFTKRSDLLKDHRGQVSFPGGAVEAGDKDIVDTALREAWEEIGIKRENIHIIGKMPEFLTISYFAVTPVVAILDWPIPLYISEHEVSKVFTIPLEWLRRPNVYEERLYTHPSGWHGTVIFFEPYQGDVLWGISAKITVDLLNEVLI